MQHTNSSSSDGELYEVETIVDSRTNTDGELEYLVQWKGYSSSQNTWEPRAHLAGALHVLKAFESKQKSANGSVELELGAKKRKRLCAAPDTHMQQATEENDSSEEERGSPAPHRAKPEDLEVLSVRVVRGDLVWTVRTRTGQKRDMSLEQVKARAPLTLIDYLISKLRFA